MQKMEKMALLNVEASENTIAEASPYVKSSENTIAKAFPNVKASDKENSFRPFSCFPLYSGRSRLLLEVFRKSLG